MMPVYLSFRDCSQRFALIFVQLSPLAFSISSSICFSNIGSHRQLSGHPVASHLTKSAKSSMRGPEPSSRSSNRASMLFFDLIKPHQLNNLSTRLMAMCIVVPNKLNFLGFVLLPFQVLNPLLKIVLHLTIGHGF